MDESAKLVVGMLLVVGLVYLVASWLFPDVLQSVNFQPINIPWKPF